LIGSEVSVDRSFLCFFLEFVCVSISLVHLAYGRLVSAFFGAKVQLFGAKVQLFGAKAQPPLPRVVEKGRRRRLRVYAFEGTQSR
jgi:hypothetical protein